MKSSSVFIIFYQIYKIDTVTRVTVIVTIVNNNFGIMEDMCDRAFSEATRDSNLEKLHLKMLEIYISFLKCKILGLAGFENSMASQTLKFSAIRRAEFV